MTWISDRQNVLNKNPLILQAPNLASMLSDSNILKKTHQIDMLYIYFLLVENNSGNDARKTIISIALKICDSQFNGRERLKSQN